MPAATTVAGWPASTARRRRSARRSRSTGVTLPYRPASVVWYRGLSAHKHAMLTGLAIALLPALTGALDVPGGLLADPYGLRGKSPSREPQFQASFEGLIQQSFIGGGRVGGMYPPRPVTPPLTPEYFELLPVGPYGAIFYLLASEQPDVWKPPTWPKMLLQYHSNIVKTSGPPDVMERFMNRFEFVVSVTRRFEETTEFADIVLPDLHYLERLAPFVFGHFASGDGRDRQLRRPSPSSTRRSRGRSPDEPYVDIMQILLDLAERAGFAGDVLPAAERDLPPEAGVRARPGPASSRTSRSSTGCCGTSTATTRGSTGTWPTVCGRRRRPSSRSTPARSSRRGRRSTSSS